MSDSFDKPQWEMESVLKKGKSFRVSLHATFSKKPTEKDYIDSILEFLFEAADDKQLERIYKMLSLVIEGDLENDPDFQSLKPN